MGEVISNNTTLCNQGIKALKNVIDPEIGLNIIDLGLVYQLDFDEAERKLFLRMTLTTQFCPMGESIQDSAKYALEQAFPGYDIQLQLVFDPPWNAEMISEEGQEFLNR